MKDFTAEYRNKKHFDKDGNPINTNLAYLRNEFDNYAIHVLNGMTRSGKTTSIIQSLFDLMFNERGKVITIARQSFLTMRGTILPDFLEEAKRMDVRVVEGKPLFEYCKEYYFNCNEIRFVSMESTETLNRLTPTDILYLVAAPEMEWQAVSELFFKTDSKVLIETYPTEDKTWVDNNILTRRDVGFLKTDYRDNPFLSERQLEEIEWMIEHDPKGAYMCHILDAVPVDKHGSAKDGVVDQIKQKTAELINLLQAVRNDEVSKTYDKSVDAKNEVSGEKLRLISLAQTSYEEAGMWAVKASTM